MRRIKILVLAVISAALVSSCGNENGKSNSNSNSGTSASKKADNSCVYTLLKDSSSVNWMAFKTTARKGVGGHFDTFNVWLPKNVNSPYDALVGTSFDITTSSVNSGNKERDPKLIKFFFEALSSGDVIKGEIKTADGDKIKGKGIIKLQFNGETKKIDYTYQIDGNSVVIKTGINLDEWDGSAAVKSLNTECYELHTGKDGVSKLWPDVEIKVVAKLKKQC